MKGRLNLYLHVAVVFILAAGCASTQMQLQLWEASEKGDTAAVQALLEQGVDVNAKDNGGGTALFYAAAYGHTDTVQALLAHGADVNAKENRKGTTALFFASVGGHTEMVRALLVGGADVNAKSNNGFTALMAAEMKGNTSIVHLLRNAGAIRLH